MQLEDTVIIVTGASRGLGARMARAFVDHGASVVCSARTASTLEAFVDDLDGPGSALSVPADVTSWDDAQRLAARTLDRYGRIDVLVNNAGVSDRGLLDGAEPTVNELPVDVWETVLRTNLDGPFLCTKAVLPSMLDADAGRLVHMSSAMGLEGRARRSAYAASKFGLEGFHESLAAELEGTGVDSVVLEPGGWRRHERLLTGAVGREPTVTAGPGGDRGAGGSTGGRRGGKTAAATLRPRGSEPSHGASTVGLMLDSRPSRRNTSSAVSRASRGRPARGSVRSGRGGVPVRSRCAPRAPR
ncbi:SDR family oxidoreductase [Salinigranum sp. GCM10025319]|uniref:SDR family oxidoreductase n=1 Tax=Salinigranum sp. GCM10025319 TaxID=3252687 RepID=UPI00360ED81E